jgi:hypothetical protein
MEADSTQLAIYAGSILAIRLELFSTFTTLTSR